MLEERKSSFPLKSPILLYLQWYMQMCMIAYAVSHLKAINMQVLFFSNESVEQQTSRQFACFLQIYELNVTAVINHISMDQMLSTWMDFTAHTTSGPITLAYNISCRKFIQMQLELHLILNCILLRPCILIWWHYIWVNFSETCHRFKSVYPVQNTFRAFQRYSMFDVSPWPLPQLGLQVCLRLF